MKRCTRTSVTLSPAAEGAYRQFYDVGQYSWSLHLQIDVAQIDVARSRRCGSQGEGSTRNWALTDSGAGNIHLQPDGERGRGAKTGSNGPGGGGMFGSVMRSLSRAKNGSNERRKD